MRRSRSFDCEYNSGSGEIMRNCRAWKILLLTALPILLLGACDKGTANPATSTGPPAVLTGSPIPALVKSVEPAIVRIDASGASAIESGSGFIIDARGYLLTNAHVIDKSAQIKVTLKNDDLYDAIVVAADAKRDVALLKLKSARTDFAWVGLGSSTGVPVGQEVLIAGYPLGPALPGPVTFHTGIVSAWRTMGGLNYIQTEATLNQGNSGGPLFDYEARVIGITVAGVVPLSIDAEGIGLCIPIDEVKRFLGDNLPK